MEEFCYEEKESLHKVINSWASFKLKFDEKDYGK